MSDMNETKDRVADAPGKRALLEAALRLGSSSRSLGPSACASWRARRA